MHIYIYANIWGPKYPKSLWSMGPHGPHGPLPLSEAASLGLTSLLILRSSETHFSRSAAAAALQWSLSSGLRVIGPTWPVSTWHGSYECSWSRVDFPIIFRSRRAMFFFWVLHSQPVWHISWSFRSLVGGEMYPKLAVVAELWMVGGGLRLSRVIPIFFRAGIRKHPLFIG